MPRTKALIDKQKFSNLFLIAVLLGILYLSYLLLKPFLIEIGVSAILVTIFYPWYLKLVYWTKGQINISALIVSLLIVLIIVVPLSYLIFFVALEIINIYNSVTADEIVNFININIWQNLDFIDKEILDIQQLVTDSFVSIKEYIIPGATAIVTEITKLVASILIIAFTMFFLFRDGRSLLRRIMHLSPLSNKYDKLIWMKFREMSFTAIASTFITAFAQALTAAVSFWIVGLPALFLGIVTFLISFVPYIGTAFVWIPVGVYYLIVGELWKGLFILIWGAVVVSFIDNLIHPYLLKGKSEVHPLILFFSIFGGMALMGFWGIVFGPLIVALAVTILHIYELEYSKALDR